MKKSFVVTVDSEERDFPANWGRSEIVDAIQDNICVHYILFFDQVPTITVKEMPNEKEV